MESTPNGRLSDSYPADVNSQTPPPQQQQPQLPSGLALLSVTAVGGQLTSFVSRELNASGSGVQSSGAASHVRGALPGSTVTSSDTTAASDSIAEPRRQSDHRGCSGIHSENVLEGSVVGDDSSSDDDDSGDDVNAQDDLHNEEDDIADFNVFDSESAADDDGDDLQSILLGFQNDGSTIPAADELQQSVVFYPPPFPAVITSDTGTVSMSASRPLTASITSASGTAGGSPSTSMALVPYVATVFDTLVPHPLWLGSVASGLLTTGSADGQQSKSAVSGKAMLSPAAAGSNTSTAAEMQSTAFTNSMAVSSSSSSSSAQYPSTSTGSSAKSKDRRQPNERVPVITSLIPQGPYSRRDTFGTAVNNSGGSTSSRAAQQCVDSLKRRTETLTQKCLRMQNESLKKANDLRIISEQLSQLRLEHAQERQYQQRLVDEYCRIREVAARAMNILRKVNVTGTMLTATEHKLADLLTDSGAETADTELNETNPRSWLTNPVQFDDAMEPLQDQVAAAGATVRAEVSSGCDSVTVADIRQPI